MRVALMTNNYKPFIGGVPISIERLAKGLEQLGHEVTIFAPTYEEQEAEESVVRYASITQNGFGGIVLPNPIDSRIEKEFRKKNYDVIHVHHPMLIGRTAVYLSKKYQVPLTFTYHTRYEQYLCHAKTFRHLEQGADRGRGMVSRMDRAMLKTAQEKIIPRYLRSFLKHCDYVFAPTKGMQDYLYDVCGVPYDKMDVLPTGLDEGSYQVTEEEKNAVRRKYNAENKELFISVSRMSYEKNVPFLLRSLALLKQRSTKPFQVLMVGEGPQKETFRQQCVDLGIADSVVFTGNIPNQELAPYFAAADAFIFASKTETQGIVVLEAFAGATPVYAVEATGVSDLVNDGTNGYLVREEEELFAERLLQALSGEHDMERLSRNAYASALTFRQEAVARKAVHLYNKAIAGYEMKHSERRELRWRFQGNGMLPAK